MSATRSMDLTLVAEWQDGQVRRFPDHLVGEEPLEIRVGRRPLSVTMRTPGNDLELAAGFLFTEGLIRGPDQIAAIAHAPRRKPAEAGNVVRVRLRGRQRDFTRTRRNFLAASACGVCGKASIDSVRLRGVRPIASAFALDPQLLCELPDALRKAQPIFGRTGGLHAAALFDAAGNLVALREDVGRHNAVDKIIGWALLEKRLPLSDFVMLVSGRGGFEIVQKAAAAGIPVLASVSAPSGLAVRLAREFRMTLVGFLRGRRFVVYSSEERLGLVSGQSACSRGA